jgi:hypothetical protein
VFDPTAYFGAIEATLADCRTYAEPDGPFLKIEFDEYDQWEIIIWRFFIRFASGCQLKALESHERRKGKHFRKIVYRFMRDTGELIFQVDPHHSAIPFDQTPHFHIGPTEDYRVEDGAWKLTIPLQDFDFLKMWELVENYERDGSVPWRQ